MPYTSTLVFRRTPEERHDQHLAWSRPDQAFFAAGACHVLAFAFCSLHPNSGFEPVSLRPATGQGSHVIATDGQWAFDHAGYARLSELLDSTRASWAAEYPGWTAELELIKDSLDSWCRATNHRPPAEYAQDAWPRALAYAARFPAPHDPRAHAGNLPDRAEAEALLSEAERLNPGPWADHSRWVARAAGAVAAAHPTLDPERAHILGLLHDIGRRAGVTDLRHLTDGYHFLMGLGYTDAARVALTHSYPLNDPACYSGRDDATPADSAFVARFISRLTYSDEDRLLQLCDALALPDGCCILEQRLVDVALRYGVTEHSLLKWRATLDLKRHFDAATGRNIYGVLPGLVERLTT